MYVGSLLLSVGDELQIAEGDYRYGSGPVHLLVRQILELREEWGVQWVVLQGLEPPNHAGPWRPRKLQIRVDALKRSLTLRAA